MTKSRIRIQTFESGWTLAGAAVWAVLPLPADAESTTLPRLYATPADDAHDPVKVALVSHGRARTNLRSFEIVAVVLGVMFTVTAAFGSFLSSSDGAAFLIGLPFFDAAVLLRLFRTIWPPTESTVWLSAEGMRVCAADGGEHRALWADLRSFTRSTASDGRDTVHLTWELVDGKRADIVLGESFDTTVLDTALQEASGSRFGPTPASPG